MPQSNPRASAAARAGAPVEPKHAVLWAALVHVVGTLVLCYPALAGRFLVNPDSDQYIAGYAFREFAAHSLRTGHGFPLWNPYLFGGMPYVAAMSGDIFYPTFLLRMALPTDVAMTWSFIIHIILAGFFTYLFLRACRFAFLPALAGGLVYMMGGPISSYVSPGHDGKLYVSALLPLVLFLLVRGIRDGKAWTWGVTAFVVGLATLSPHPQLLQYLLLISGAFALWLAFTAERDGGRLDRPVAIRRLGLALGAVVLGLIMGAIQFLPVFEYVPWSPRAGGLRGWDLAVSYSFPPEELVNTYIPQFTGILDHYWGRNGIHFHSEYLGAVVLVLAVLGLAAAWRGARRSFGRFWIVTGAVALIWSLGGYTPFYHLVYAIVPGTKFFRAPSTMFFTVGLVIALLAAFGLERVLDAQVTRRYAAGWLIASAVVLLLGVTGALSSMAEAIASTEVAELVHANAPDLLLGAVRTAIFTALAAGLLFACAAGKVQARHTALILIALAGVDLWSVERLYWRFSPPASQVFAADATTQYVLQQPVPGRVWARPLSAQFARHDPFLLGDALMVHGVRLVLGYHGNELGRYDQLVDKDEGYRAVASPQVWKLLDIRYLLTNVDSLPVAGFTRVAGPAVDAAGTTLYLYALPGDAQPAWVAPAIVKAADDAVLATVLDQRFDVRRVALFDTSAAVTGQHLTALPDTIPVTASVTRYDPGHIEIALSQPAPHGSALVVSENYYPGWHATVDGTPATVGRADYTLIGVALPDGARRIVLDYASATYERGKWITLATIPVMLLAFGAGIVTDRKRHG